MAAAPPGSFGEGQGSLLHCVLVRGPWPGPSQGELLAAVAACAGEPCARLEYDADAAPPRTGRGKAVFAAKAWFATAGAGERLAAAAATRGLECRLVLVMPKLRPPPAVAPCDTVAERVKLAFRHHIQVQAQTVQVQSGGVGVIALDKAGLRASDVGLVVSQLRACGASARQLSLCGNAELRNVGELAAEVRRGGSVSRVAFDGCCAADSGDTSFEELAGAAAVNLLRQVDAGTAGAWDLLRSLNERRLGDGGAAQVAALLAGAVTPLRLPVLGVAKNGIGLAGGSALAAAMLQPGAGQVRLLELYSNRPDPGWAACLAPVIRFGSLTSLDLGSLGIDDAGCAVLCDALRGSRLEELHLDYNQVSESGVTVLQAVAPLATRLHTLWLHGNPASRESQRQLRLLLAANRMQLPPGMVRAALEARVAILAQEAEQEAERTLAVQHEPELLQHQEHEQQQQQQQQRQRQQRQQRHGKQHSQQLDERDDGLEQRRLKPRVESLADRVARAALQAYCELCPGHAAESCGQLVLAAVVLERVRDHEHGAHPLEVLSLGLGTRFVDPLLLFGDALDAERVRDSHAEVIARRGLRRYLCAQLVLAKRGLPSVLARVAGSPRLALREGLRLHLYTSAAPCGAASTKGLSLPSGKGGGSTCTAWQPGMRRSCTDKVLRWCREGLAGKRLHAALDPAGLRPASVVVGRRWSERCAETLPAAERTWLLLEDMVHRPAQNTRGDSDTCVSWSRGGQVERYDGKTGLSVDAHPPGLSKWWLGQEEQLACEEPTSVDL